MGIDATPKMTLLDFGILSNLADVINYASFILGRSRVFVRRGVGNVHSLHLTSTAHNPVTQAISQDFVLGRGCKREHGGTD
jgi:hypothetical protein